jgi:hypothetical protein
MDEYRAAFMKLLEYQERTGDVELLVLLNNLNTALPKVAEDLSQTIKKGLA